MQKLNERLLAGGAPVVCYKHSFPYILFLSTTQVLERDSFYYEASFLDKQQQGHFHVALCSDIAPQE